jgi:uncharacterized phage protein gp47/JayE
MAFNIPTSQKQVIDRTATDVQLALPESNPFFKNSFLGALIFSFAGRIFDFYLQLNILIRELFVDTATDSFLERWGTYRSITRNAATQSTGTITATGTATSTIAIGTQLSDAAGNIFETTAAATITATSISISSLSRSGSTVTATTASNHQFASTQDVTISGAVETGYNGVQQITVTGLNTFTYTISTTPTTPATGTILAAADLASVSVRSVGYGEDQNLDNGTQLTFSSPVSGVDDTAIVQYATVAGGTDLESDEDLRIRIIDVYQNPISHFNESDITSKAKALAGVTRVFIYGAGDSFGDSAAITSITRSGSIATVTTTAAHGLENCMAVTISGADQADYNITARVLVLSTTTFCYVVSNTPTTPATGTIVFTSSVPLGQTIVYFTRDNDTNIIPSNSEVDALEAQLFTIKPANTSDSDFIIRAPTPVTVDFTFTALTPNTSTMQAAITANLTALFQESTTVGGDLKAFSYNSAIFQTIDPTTGDVVTDFTLSAPSGTVTIDAGELPVLGGITYP